MCEKFTLAKSQMMIIACCSTYYLFLGPMKIFFLQEIVIRLQIQEFKNSISEPRKFSLSCTCANRSGGPNKKNYWLNVSGQHCLLAEGDIGAPIYERTDVPRAITIG
jgi:hypothetical protein